MSFLTVSDLSKQLGVFALKDIHFQQPRFQKTAITGETGSGKSTLLKLIAGLIQPDSGKIVFEGRRVEGPYEKLIPGHPGIAYLSQHYELRNNYRMEELLEAANRLPEQEAKRLYALCRIDHLLKRKNDQLSGGEKQRMALARLLTGAPKLLLLDEPFSNLDLLHKNMLKQVLEDIGHHLQMTTLLTSHDPMDTLSWANTILVMRSGHIIQEGSATAVYQHPKDAYVAGLFGSYNELTAAELLPFDLPRKKELNGTAYFIRPEQFRILPAGVPGVEGRIQQVTFWGSYFELKVSVANKILLVKTMESHWQPGQTIRLSLS